MGLDARVRARRATFELDLSLAVAPGEVTAVVGPNGAGKTMLLRCLAGLVPLDYGRVVLDGQVLEDTAAGIWVAPERRPVGMVFQGSWLFPHLSVVDNVAFGLPGRRSVARRLARPWVDTVGLGALAGTRAGSLSGGEAQRAALARALAPRPLLLLLDEPLAAVDAAARPGLRRLVAETLSGYEGTRIVVTHEPLEALTLAHRLVVLEAGRVTQAGTVAQVTAQPRSPWVAAMVGLNLFRGRARNGLLVVGDGSLTVASDVTGEVFAVVHPRAVTLSRHEPHGSARNAWSGIAAGLDLEGERVRVRVEGSPAVVAEVTPAAAAELGLASGGRVWASVKATEIDVYPA